MKFSALKCLALGCLLAAAARAAGPWDDLRPGMSQAQVLRLVGNPLIATRGHGYVRWSFDALGDVTFYRGQLVSWTAPRPGPAQTSP